MKLLTHIPSWIKNKFLIATAIFAFVMLFFDKNDLFTQMDRKRQLRELVQSKKYFTDQIAGVQAILDEMRTNPRTIERLSREKYFMKRDDEDLYVIPENSPERQ